MKKSNKVLIIVAAVLVAVGILLVGVACALGIKMNENKVQEVTYTSQEPFTKIMVNSTDADVEIKISENGKVYAVCDESDKVTFTLSVTDGTLVLKEKDTRGIIDYIGINLDGHDAVLYIPHGEYEELNVKTESGSISCDESGIVFTNVSLQSSSGEIEFSSKVTQTLTSKTSSGEIDISDCAASVLTAESSSGRITISNSTPNVLYAEASSGNVKLDKVTANSLIEANTQSGRITLDYCDAGELMLESSSGSIRGTLLTDKIFDATSSSGSINCPPSVKDAGKCTVKTSSGSIKFEIVG